MSEILSGAGPLLGAIMLPLLSGMLTLGAIFGNQRMSVGFALALGYALGMGILGQLMVLMGRLDLCVNKDSVSFALFIYIAVIFSLFLSRLYFLRPKSIEFLKNKEEAWGPIGKIFFTIALAYILYQMSYIFWNAFFVPIDHPDAFSNYAYKAKIFFYTNSLRQPSKLYLLGKYLQYPLQVPLDMAWVAFNMGRWHEGWVRMIFPLNCLAFIVIVYHWMKFWTGRWTALLTVALLLSSLFFVIHASIAYCDFTVMFYTMVSLLLISWGIYARSTSLVLLGGLMSAFAASVKLEGAIYCVLGGIVLCRFIFTKEFFNLQFALKALGGFLLPLMIVGSNFILFRAHYLIPPAWKQPDYVLPSQGGLTYLASMGVKAHLIIMFFALLDNLFLSGNWNILWFFLAVVAIAVRKQKKFFMARFLEFALLLFLADYGIFSLLPNNFFYKVGSINSASRFLLHFYPLCPLLIGLSAHHFLKNRRLHVVSP